MTAHLRFPTLLRSLPLLLATLCLQAEQANPGNEVQFQDPTKPGHLKIFIARGDLHITPGDKPGLVRVSSNSELKPKKVIREDGLRVLSDTGDVYTLNVKGNNAELSYGKDNWPGTTEANLDLSVPKDTILEIQNGWGGSIKIENLDGDTSIKGLNCEVELKDVAGATSIETMNGAISANYRDLPSGKAISISTMNGEVTLRVPETAGAKVRFRSHNGAILTDFSDDRLKTSSENLGGTSWGTMAGKHVVIAAHIMKEVGREIADTAREAAEDAKEAAEDAREAAMDAEEAKAEAQAEANEENNAVTQPKAPRPPRPPRMPSPPNIPAISGGKVVSGDLNGGGIPIQITTMNGDITFRHR